MTWTGNIFWLCKPTTVMHWVSYINISPINIGQYWSIFYWRTCSHTPVNIGRYWSISTDIDQYRRILINIDGYWSISTDIDQYRRILINIDGTRSHAGNIDGYWPILVNIGVVWTRRINIYAYFSSISRRYWRQECAAHSLLQYRRILMRNAHRDLYDVFTRRQYWPILVNIGRYWSISTDIDQYWSILASCEHVVYISMCISHQYWPISGDIVASWKDRSKTGGLLNV